MKESSWFPEYLASLQASEMASLRNVFSPCSQLFWQFPLLGVCNSYKITSEVALSIKNHVEYPDRLCQSAVEKFPNPCRSSEQDWAHETTGNQSRQVVCWKFVTLINKTDAMWVSLAMTNSNKMSSGLHGLGWTVCETLEIFQHQFLWGIY